MFACVVEQDVGAENVGLDEFGGAEDRAVDVSLGREVENRCAALGRAADGIAVGDVALDELDVRPFEIRSIARVGELVENDDLVSTGCESLRAVGADEAGSACDQDSHRPEA